MGQERGPLGPEAARGADRLSADPDVLAYYGRGHEAGRLLAGAGRLELARTQEIVRRHLPPPPARVLDVGGGAGVHASWLAAGGHRVHLVDPVELHVAQAVEAARATGIDLTAAVGDARALDVDDASADAVLLLGPLYHLVEREDRLAALREARRAAGHGAPVFVAAISRYASLFDGLVRGFFADPAFRANLARTLREGRHTNPTRQPDWFTTAYFHHPDELRDEVLAAGLDLVELVAVEGPAMVLGDLGERWDGDPEWRAAVLDVCRALEAEPSLLGSGGHLMAVARRPA